MEKVSEWQRSLLTPRLLLMFPRQLDTWSGDWDLRVFSMDRWETHLEVRQSSNTGFARDPLCDLGLMMSPLCFSLLIYKTGHNHRAYLREW